MFAGFALGAVLMIAAGIVEIFLGVECAGRELEDIAAPLSARDIEEHRGEAYDVFTLGRDQRIVPVAEARAAFGGRLVRDVMVRDPVMVDADMPLDRFVEEIFLEHRHTAYPVTEDGDVVGIISVRDALELPRSQWPSVRVRHRMTGRAEALVIPADTDLALALHDPSATRIRRALVSDGDEIGLLSMTDAARMFEVLAEVDAGYLGGAPAGRFTRPPATKPTARSTS